jgi:hypothetical protein
MRLFRVAAAVEFLSLLALLVNLATAHLPAITSLCGPIHGCAYLFVVVATMRAPTVSMSTTTKVLAWLPGVGGLLVLRREAGRAFARPAP